MLENETPLEGSWWALLFHPVLFPVHVTLMVGAVLAWVITTPVRNVGWALVTNVGALCWKHIELALRVAEGYVTTIKNEELRTLQAGEYVWALCEAVFVVPMEVIDANRSEYGAYGDLAYKGWDFQRELWCVYIPDTLQQLYSSSCRYACGWLTACVASYRRAQGLVSGTFWVVMLLSAVGLYIPLTLLRVLEVVLRGWKGVMAIVLLADTSCWAYGWGGWIPFVTAAGIVLAVAMLVIKELQVGAKLDKVAPNRVARHGWNRVLSDAKDRRKREQRALQDLAGEGELPQGATDRKERGVAVNAPEERSPCAIQAEIRQQKQRVELLEQEYQENVRVRRGRLNLSRGGCPAPGCGDGGDVSSTVRQAFKA